MVALARSTAWSVPALFAPRGLPLPDSRRAFLAAAAKAEA